MQKVTETFYKAFARLDAEAMVACYHNDIVFSDPAFGILKGDKAKNMWRMLCRSQKGQYFVVGFSKIEIKDQTGTAYWEARYIFNKTGRKIHNKIHASFEFKDGKIIKHTDYFNLHEWAIQALGFSGLLFGWTNFFKRKLNSQTNKLLLKFENSRNY